MFIDAPRHLLRRSGFGTDVGRTRCGTRNATREACGSLPASQGTLPLGEGGGRGFGGERPDDDWPDDDDDDD